MLQNPQWDYHTLVGLRDWLARQPADTPYTWSSCQNCVVGKYLEAHGQPHLFYSIWIEQTPGACRAVAECFSDFAGYGGGRKPMTMGDALKNLDAWMAAN